MQQLKSMSQHYVNNAMYQTKLPLSNKKHGANKNHGCMHTIQMRLYLHLQLQLT